MQTPISGAISHLKIGQFFMPFRPLTKSELDVAKKAKDDFYRQIEIVVLPDWLKNLFPSCRVFVGGCVERGVGSAFRHLAHAHNSTKYPDPNFGCLCFRSIKRIGQYRIISMNDGRVQIIVDKPSRLMLHEFAHLLALNQGHNPTFYRRYKELLKLYRENK